MKFPLKYAFLFVLVLNLACTNSPKENYQLVIANVSLFDSNTGKIIPRQTVFVQQGRIRKIETANASHLGLESAIDAKGKLLTPGFIDVHNHLNFTFGDSIATVTSQEFSAFRAVLSAAYLPYGVTTVRSAGGRESTLPMELSWTQSEEDYIDYYPTGGAFVSLNTNFYNHIFVPDTASVNQKIRDYYDSGVRHIKAYGLLGAPQLKAAVETAGKLNMNIFGHIENSMISIDSATTFGLQNLEHVKTLFLEVIRNYERKGMDLSMLPEDDYENWRFREYEIFNMLGTQDSSILGLVKTLQKRKVSITPTIHIYAHPIELTEEQLQMPIYNGDKLNWTGDKLERAQKGYGELAKLSLLLHQNGVRLATGSDTFDPGKAILSEMLLLQKAGIPMNEVLQIATLNSAKSIERDSIYGSLEVGKKAHMILFEKSPLENPLHLIAEKTIIKDGAVWNKKSIPE